MLQVSDNAKALLNEMLEGRPDEAQIFRLARKGEGFELTLEVPAQDDVLFQHGEAHVLAVASDVAESLDGLTIDREDTVDGPRLVLVE